MAHRIVTRALALAVLLFVGLGAAPAIARSGPDPLVVRYSIDAPTPDVEAQVALHATRYRQITGYLNAVHVAEVAEAARQAQLEAARRPAQRSAASSSHPTAGGGDTGGRHFICPQFASGDNPTGDFAIPCSNIDNESDGNYTADNPDSSAYGAYQILHLPPGTPPAEQDRIARGMDLCNWHPPNYCAG